MRLEGTDDINRGRLEVYRSGFGWYSFCDHFWGMNDAHVACREMGFINARAVYHNAHYGRRNRGKVIDCHPHCTGQEASLRDCPMSWNRFWRGGCDDRQSIGIDCNLFDEN